MMLSIAILLTAFLFGGMTLYSFGFAAFIFNALPAAQAGSVLRRAFPWFYVFVMATAAVAALCWWSSNVMFAAVLAAVALTTIPARQILMPAINQATDAGQRTRFKWLHSASVLLTLAHIIAVGWIVTRLAVVVA